MGHLISSTSMLEAARSQGFGITAFNVHTLEMLQAVVDAAEEAQAPLILQTTVGTVHHLGPEYIVEAARVAAKRARIPVALHLDHCTDYDVLIRCIQAGYTSVMIDASMHPFEENIRRTLEVVRVAKAAGVNVEAELGKVGGVEDDIVVDEADAYLADPTACVEFVERTGVPTFAPAIGTSHGMYKSAPNIAFDKLEEIYRTVSVPLVLHGGSGIPADQVRRCISLGIGKMNVATELRIAFSDAIKQVFEQNPKENDPRKYMIPAKQAVKQLALAKMELTGCINRARDVV